MKFVEKFIKRIETLEEQHEEEEENRVLALIPDNGRGPTGTGRHGNVIVYDEQHPAESFMRSEERRGRPPAPCPL
jgi:hypothetical protein